jgi:hypothetical protein
MDPAVASKRKYDWGMIYGGVPAVPSQWPWIHRAGDGGIHRESMCLVGEIIIGCVPW